MMKNPDAAHITFEADAGAGPEWSLVALGDVCVQGRLAPSANAAAAALQLVDPALAAIMTTADVTIANLEAPVREASVSGASARAKSGPAIALDPLAPAALAACGIGVASLANNHIMDYGAGGLARTLEACRAAGLRTVGAGADAGAAGAPLTVEVAGGMRIAIVACCEREFGIAEPDAPGAAWIGSPALARTIADAAAHHDLVIAVAHGGVEEVPLPPPERVDQLRALIDAGARVVIGHHPHVPHGWERYGGGIIFHSLGNFLFDYPDGLRYPATEWGLMLRMRFRGAQPLAAELMPIESRPGEPVVAMRDAAVRERALAYLDELSEIMADRPRFEAYWQAIAVHLWRTRYRRWLQRSAGASSGGSMRTHVKGFARALRRRLGGPANAAAPPELGDPLMLLNLLRNESHRWSIAAALAVETGDAVDRRTPEIERHVRDLLHWTEGG